MADKLSARAREEQFRIEIASFQRHKQDPDAEWAKRGTSRMALCCEIAELYLEEIKEMEIASQKQRLLYSAVSIFKTNNIDPDEGFKRLGKTRKELYFALGACFLEESEKIINPTLRKEYFNKALSTWWSGKIDPVEALKVFGLTLEEVAARIQNSDPEFGPIVPVREFPQRSSRKPDTI